MSGPFNVHVDREAEVITIQGIRYAFDVFTYLGFGQPGTRFEIGERHDGVVTLKTLPGKKP